MAKAKITGNKPKNSSKKLTLRQEVAMLRREVRHVKRELRARSSHVGAMPSLRLPAWDRKHRARRKAHR